MACTPEVLKNVALFALLDDEELAVLAGQVDLKRFASRERIYKIGDRSGAGIRYDLRKGASDHRRRRSAGSRHR